MNLLECRQCRYYLESISDCPLCRYEHEIVARAVFRDEVLSCPRERKQGQ